jgi:3-oxoacyl-[acyl-carrier-protein] synthase III
MSSAMNKVAAGIYGIGTYLPPVIRTNDWWSEEILAEWKSRESGKIDRPVTSKDEGQSEGSRLVQEAMSKYRGDPFRGCKQRHVMPEGMLTSEMDIIAAKGALEKAGVEAGEIDVLMCYSTLPDYYMVANAATVHRALGMSRSCFTAQTDGVCNSFLQQLVYADSMILTGAARYALLVQSSGTSRLTRPEDPHSAWFGDGATAVVLGPVRDGYGVVGWSHETWSHLVEGIVCGIPGKRWWEGSPYAYIERPELARALVIDLFHESRRLIHDSLASAGHGPKDVDFYACHQGFAWLREATQKHAGLDNAKFVDTFSFASSLLGANIPLVLAIAQQEGMLKEGDLISTFSGAAGAMISSATIRWGGRAQDVRP